MSIKFCIDYGSLMGNALELNIFAPLNFMLDAAHTKCDLCQNNEDYMSKMKKSVIA
jgi:hypothetical protein